MVAAVDTIPSMGKKKGKTGGEKPDAASEPRKPNRYPSRTVYARLSPALGAALDAFIASLRPEPTLASVLEMFIEDGLKQKGFWPPADAGGAGGEGGA